MAVAGGPNIVEDGLVLCLDAGNSRSYPGSGTAWSNLVATSNTGTLTNGPTYSSANGGAIVFDGTNDFCDFGSMSGSFSSFSVIVWFYPTNVANYKNVIDCNFNFYGSGNVGPRLEMNSSGNLIWGYSNITTNNDACYGHEVRTSGLAVNTWHCAAITYNGNGNTSATYYNGNQTTLNRITYSGSGGTILPSGFVGSMNKVVIGKGWYDGVPDRVYAGRVSIGLIYNRALTAAEVAQNFNATRSRYGI